MCHPVGMQLYQPMRNQMRKFACNQIFMSFGAHLGQLVVMQLYQLVMSAICQKSLGKCQKCKSVSKTLH
jgi:hypothetical protein